MRLALVLLVLSGCVTVVVAPGEASGAVPSLARAQRDAQVQDAGLRRASLDALTATAARIATDVQAYALKPAAFGGGDGAVGGATFERLGYPTEAGPDSLHVTPDGAFRLGRDGDAVLVRGESRIFGHGVTARVGGTGWRDLSLTVRPR